jgi:GT2 family glycosyltransferase
LLNADTEVRSGWLAVLGTFLDRHRSAGCAQAKLLLHARNRTLNTAGNRSHYLGFGMMTGYGEPDHRQYDQRRKIDFPSGAAVMIRMSVLEQLGLFDENFYMYLEDADLGWKLRQAGHDCFFVPDAVVYHKYVPDAAVSFYEHFERNRWLLLLTYYKRRTLLVLAPALAIMEVGQLVYATASGRLGAKLRSWRWFGPRAHRDHVRRRRRVARQFRARSDRQFTQGFSGTVELPAGQPLLLRCLANPLLAGYWRIMKRLIYW